MFSSSDGTMGQAAGCPSHIKEGNTVFSLHRPVER